MGLACREGTRMHAMLPPLQYGEKRGRSMWSINYGSSRLWEDPANFDKPSLAMVPSHSCKLGSVTKVPRMRACMGESQSSIVRTSMIIWYWRERAHEPSYPITWHISAGSSLRGWLGPCNRHPCEAKVPIHIWLFRPNCQNLNRNKYYSLCNALIFI